MRIISHRGNLSGPNSAFYGENHPSSVRSALMSGYDVEVDIRFMGGKFVLGHDIGEFEVNNDFFYNCRLWVHAKNIEALSKLINNPLINVFYHDKDGFALTSQKFIWTYPDEKFELLDSSIAVMPELVGGWGDVGKCYGVCTDYADDMKKNINFKLVNDEKFHSDFDI